jgi:type IV pilus assembly protein PilE
VTITILGILVAVALPSYNSSVRKGRRAEAFAAIAAVQQAQERWRANNAQYGNLNVPADSSSLPANVPRSSSNGRYTLATSNLSASGYTVVATAQGAQAEDGSCKLLGARMAGGNVVFGSGASSIDWAAANPDAGQCWAR